MREDFAIKTPQKKIEEFRGIASKEVIDDWQFLEVKYWCQTANLVGIIRLDG